MATDPYIFTERTRPEFQFFLVSYSRFANFIRFIKVIAQTPFWRALINSYLELFQDELLISERLMFFWNRSLLRSQNMKFHYFMYYVLILWNLNLLTVILTLKAVCVGETFIHEHSVVPLLIFHSIFGLDCSIISERSHFYN